MTARVLTLLQVMVLLVSMVKGNEPTNCSSLVQRESSARSRTTDALETEAGTWAAFMQRNHQMLSTYMSTYVSDMARVLAGQKPQSNSSGMMTMISVGITVVMLTGGFILLGRVHKAWREQSAGAHGAPSRHVQGSSTVIGSSRAVQRAPKPTAEIDSRSSLGAARPREELPVLCDDLVVPENRECILLVPKLDSNEVAINDHQGQQVFIARCPEEDARIVLTSPTDEVFSTVRTARTAGMAALAVHGPYDSEFGILKGMPSGDYELTGSGRRIRFQTSSGRLNVVDEDTRIMAFSESEGGQRQFRIGPRVDVGLVITCILGIDLLQKDFR